MSAFLSYASGGQVTYSFKSLDPCVGRLTKAKNAKLGGVVQSQCTTSFSSLQPGVCPQGEDTETPCPVRMRFTMWMGVVETLPRVPRAVMHIWVWYRNPASQLFICLFTRTQVQTPVPHLQWRGSFISGEAALQVSVSLSLSFQAQFLFLCDK